MYLPGLVERAYEAALDPTAWPECLVAVRDAFRVEFAHIFSEDLRHRDATLSLETGMDPASKAEYYQHYFFLDPGWLAKQRLPAGVATASNQLMPDREYERQEYYADFARRYGIFYQMGCTIQRSEHGAAFLGMVRAREQGGFERRDLRRLEAFVPHLRQALAIAHRLGTLAAQNGTLVDLLGRLHLGVVLLDERGAVLLANDVAQRIADATAILRLGADGLHAADPTLERRLQSVIGACLGTALGERLEPGGVLRVNDAAGGVAVALRVAPLRADPVGLRLESRTPRAIVFISDVAAPPQVSAKRLKELYGLTAAEAEVTALLSQGRPPVAIARDTARSPNTVRTQLRAAMQKTGTARQADLVRRVLTSPSALMAAADGASDGTPDPS